jgi:taurine dioxygenase
MTRIDAPHTGGIHMAELELRDLTPAFGTEITGLDPLAALSHVRTTQRLRELFDTRGVLVFRDVDLDANTQANLIRAVIGMGPLAAGESGSARANGDPFYVSNKEPQGGAPFGRLLFHSDMMWSEHTFRVLSLYGVEVEQPATPTIFVSATDGWKSLPDDLRAEAEERSAVQGHEAGGRAADDPNVLVSKFDDLPTRTTPVGMTHPRTGDTVLYVSQQMTQSIDGLEHDEGEALLERLFAHLYRDEAVYEHDWRGHDLVAWDNIAVQHARPNVTLEGPVRTLRKVYAPVPPKGANPKRPTFASAG